MNGELNKTMGQIIARAWSDAAFKQRLLDQPLAALAELGMAVPEGKTISAVENVPDTVNVVLTSPRYTETRSTYADIKEYGETYWDPRLFPLKWGSHDPVFTARFKADPRAALRSMNVDVPEGLAINVVENSRTHAYLVLPSVPNDPGLRKDLMAKLERGEVPATLRYADLVSMTHDQLVWSSSH